MNLLAPTPDRPAVHWREHWLSYREMNRRADALAARLFEAGVRRGDRVAILAVNHIAHFDLLLAAPRLGFVLAPFNHRLAAPEQKTLAEQLTPKLMLHDAAHAVTAAATGVALRTLDHYEDWLNAAPAPPPVAALDENALHLLLFTGGSTGLPKAAGIPYRQILANARATCSAWQVGADDCAIQAAPCFHAALNVFTTPLLAAGGRIVLMPAFAPAEFLRLTQEQGVTVWFLVPTMYRMLTEDPGFARADLSRLRWAISGGAPCPAPLAQAFAARGLRFKQGYGMTECGVNCFTIDLDEAARHPAAVGRPMPGLQAAIRNADGGEVATGEVGELTLSGAQVFAGYYGRAQETADALRDGWLWTGDLARRDENGLYFIVGRRKEMFISGGENVFPVEVESAMHQLAGIAECAVLGVPDARWGEVGLAAVAVAPGAHWDEGMLCEALRPLLAGYKLPREFLFLDTLPKTGAGKIDKPALRRRFLAGRGA